MASPVVKWVTDHQAVQQMFRIAQDRQQQVWDSVPRLRDANGTVFAELSLRDQTIGRAGPITIEDVVIHIAEPKLTLEQALQLAVWITNLVFDRGTIPPVETVEDKPVARRMTLPEE